MDSMNIFFVCQQNSLLFFLLLPKINAMKKILIIIGLIILLGILFFPDEKREVNTLSIQTSSLLGKQYTGKAFQISPHFFVAPAHVFPGKTIQITPSLTVVKLWHNNDIALLYSDTYNTFSHYCFFENLENTAVFESKEYEILQADEKYFSLKAPALSGHSGTPSINTEGKIVGMFVGEKEGMARFLNAPFIIETLQSWITPEIHDDEYPYYEILDMCR